MSGRGLVIELLPKIFDLTLNLPDGCYLLPRNPIEELTGHGRRQIFSAPRSVKPTRAKAGCEGCMVEAPKTDPIFDFVLARNCHNCVQHRIHDEWLHRHHL